MMPTMNGDAIASHVAARTPPMTVKISLIASAMPCSGVKSASSQELCRKPEQNG